ncbi:9687_t:CDS:1, partial [Paraglomus occultum]
MFHHAITAYLQATPNDEQFVLIKKLQGEFTAPNDAYPEWISFEEIVQGKSTTPNDAYLEWIPFENFDAADSETGRYFLYGLPTTTYKKMSLIPVE